MRKAYPHNLQRERDILGCLLRYPAQIGQVRTLGLEPWHWYDPAHRRLYALLADMDASQVEQGEAPIKIAGADFPNDYPDAEALRLMQRDAAPQATIPTYTREVIQDGRRRKVATLLSKMQDTICDGGQDLDGIVEATIAGLRAPELWHQPTADRSMAKGLDDLIHTIEDALYHTDIPPTVAFYGFAALDGQICLSPGDLHILAARPGVGKTALALDTAEKVLQANATTHVCVYSLEAPTAQLAHRIACRDIGVSPHAIRTHRITEAQMRALHTRVQRLKDEGAVGRLRVVDTYLQTVSQIRADVAAQQQQGRHVSLVIIDYLQLMDAPKSHSREREVATISRGLKGLAKDLGVPVLALAQINREVDKRAKGRPRMSDLRESGAIEQDADCIIFLHRDRDPDVDRSAPGACDLIVEKYRHGPHEDAQLWFDRGHFIDLPCSL